ncbi:hypothetical protein DV735_g5983, partial [Chaetothyriales sp. CBS 134920]
QDEWLREQLQALVEEKAQQERRYEELERRYMEQERRYMEQERRHREEKALQERRYAEEKARQERQMEMLQQVLNRVDQPTAAAVLKVLRLGPRLEAVDMTQAITAANMTQLFPEVRTRLIGQDLEPTSIPAGDAASDNTDLAGYDAE